MTTIRNIAAAASLTVAAFGFAGTASAQECSSGFIAGYLCDAGVIPPEVAQTADRLNGAAGRPIDNAIYSGIDTLAPGVGTAARTYANMSNRSGRGGDRGGAPQLGYAPQQGYAPEPGYGTQQNYGPRGYNPQPNYGQQQSYGQPSVTFRCNTPMGPAIVNQAMIPGAGCWVMTPNGVVTGIAGF